MNPRVLIVAEVFVVLVLFFVLRAALRAAGFSAWQEPLFGAAILSSCLLLFVLPLAARLVAGQVPGARGWQSGELDQQGRLAWRALAFVMPTTMLFPVIALLGSDPQQWLGGSILALGFGAATVGIVFTTRHRRSIAEAPLTLRGLGGYAALLLVGVALCVVLQPRVELLRRLLTALVFVGLLEEFFFRGYVQSRLNEAFGRPYSLGGVDYGAGLVLAALVFGLFHPLSVVGDNPWAWALWTAVGGLTFGYLREKSGGVLTPALVHGVMLLPGVLFGAV